MTASECARTYVGTPFEAMGRLKGAGVDCIGLVIGVGREMGVLGDDFKTPVYDANGDSALVVAGIETFCRPISLEEMAPGDIAGFEWLGETRHVGIVGAMPEGIGGLSVIHAYFPMHRVVEMPLDLKWQNRITAVWRAPWLN